MNQTIQTIKVKMQDGKILAKSTKSEFELEFCNASASLCVKGHSHLPDARLLVPVNPIWWLDDAAQNGEWIEFEFTYGIAGK